MFVVVEQLVEVEVREREGGREMDGCFMGGRWVDSVAVFESGGGLIKEWMGLISKGRGGQREAGFLV